MNPAEPTPFSDPKLDTPEPNNGNENSTHETPSDVDELEPVVVVAGNAESGEVVIPIDAEGNMAPTIEVVPTSEEQVLEPTVSVEPQLELPSDHADPSAEPEQQLHERAEVEAATDAEPQPVLSDEAATPVPPPPSLPPQPVPEVPTAPSSQDLSRIAQDMQIRKQQVETVVQLLDEGNTVPFMTRYRKERTGNLDEVQIRRIQARVVQLRELASRKHSILRSIAGQGRLDDELVEAILHAEHPKRLEDLYLPFKPKKRTLASDARDKGLEPLAMAIWTRDPAVDNLDEIIPGMVDGWKQLHDANDVLTGVKNILAEVIAERADVRGSVRAFTWDMGQLVSVKNETAPENKGAEYRDYFDFKEPVKFIPPHRILAVNRGERENIIRIRVAVDNIHARDIALNCLPLDDHPHRELILPVVDDAVNRLLLPSLEREVRRELTDVAQNHAVQTFSRNLGSLLMRPPLGRRRVLAIDPGIRTGCKIAALDETGTLLEDGVVYIHGSKKKTETAKRRLEQIIRRHQTNVVAIGNGTACREVEEVIGDLIAEFEERRINPQPASSPIEQVSSSTDTSGPSMESQQSERESDTPAEEPQPDSSTPSMDPAYTESIMPTGMAETTMVTPIDGMGEMPTVVGHEPGASTDSETVHPPTFEAPEPKEKKPEPPPISMEGLAEPPEDLVYVIVNEAGASDYSASPIAKEEFPNLDATMRGTISIGRRLQDPLSELVKVDPQHVGVGLYQHDVKAKALRHSVEAVIESCVNAIGVDLNTASVPLLRHVSGLNQLVAREIVEYRNQNGEFKSRDELKNVPQMGENRFTQAAGFLKLPNAAEPFDHTWVHPESYELARKVLAEAGFEAKELFEREKFNAFCQKLNELNPAELATKFESGEPTIRDIFEALARPGRDPRDDRPQAIFRKGILKLEDLEQGMELTGEVLNVVDFGAFVDVGLKDSGLVHISQVANRYIKSPHEVVAVGDVVRVWVMGVDNERHRVSLSMIPPGVERRPQERAPRGQRPPRGEGRPPRAERPPQPQGERPPQQPRPPQAERPPQQPRPAGAPRPGGGPGGPPRPAGAPGGPPKPGGGFKPRSPGAPGWRSAGKKPDAPKVTLNSEKAAIEAEAASKPDTSKKPTTPKASPRLNESQKKGKEPVYSFSQLAALMRKEEEKPKDSE